MGIRFSLVYPTRHRPEFIRQALLFLTRQTYADFEVIVSDNYTDATQSCEQICRASGLTNLRYVRPPEPVGMVGNWNYGFQFATGDYIAYFTDKMWLLPDTLARAAAAISESGSEIVSWPDSTYTPTTYPDYFGPGKFDFLPIPAQPFHSFVPLEALSWKGNATVPRPEQDHYSYARGKICFGAFSRELCDRIVQRAGALFHPIAPDYTSMILGLSLARTGCQLNGSGILHLQTDVSNGALTATHDDLALRFLTDLGGIDQLLANLPVPGLYSAQNNIVAGDYNSLKRRFGLPFEFSLPQWLVYMDEDLADPGRVWSNPAVEAEHKAMFARFLDTLDETQRSRYHALREQRHAAKRSAAPAPAPRRRLPVGIERSLRRAARAVLPRAVAAPLKELITRQPASSSSSPSPWRTVNCGSADDVLDVSLAGGAAASSETTHSTSKQVIHG